MSKPLVKKRFDSGSGLPLGWTVPSTRTSIGFAAPHRTLADELISFAGDSHLLTIGPTASGKGRAAVLPALLSHRGAALIIDIKGENYHVAG